MPSTLSSHFFFFFNDTATTEIYTLSYTTLFRSQPAGIPRYFGQSLGFSGTGLDISEIIQTPRSEEHTSELQSQSNLVCRLLLEKKKTKATILRRSSTSVLIAEVCAAGCARPSTR